MNVDKIPKIRVLVRKRPLSKKQQQKGQKDIIAVTNNQTVIVREQKVKVDQTPYIHEYKVNFDGAYDDSATNEQIYLTSVRPLVSCAFDGAKVTCFAYGQTGSGKTHTMLGDGENVHGLYLLAAHDIFEQLKLCQKMSAWISFYEIYCGKLYDLLNDKNLLYAREDAKNNVNIVGLSQRKISNVQNLMQVIEFGTGARVTAQNNTNSDSSRSHAILSINLKNGNKLHGKISFIDLAGSERAADHANQVEKQTQIDGAEINKSLLALKECIRALDQNKNHVPFRGSKLTMVLKDSFTGYCKTVMIGNISPNSSSCENTLNTLKYADRVKQLKKPSKDNFIDMDNLDILSKELMLPRQQVNYRRISANNKVQDPVSTQKALNPYNYSTREKNHSQYHHEKKIKQSPPLFLKVNKTAQNAQARQFHPEGSVRSSPYPKNRKKSPSIPSSLNYSPQISKVHPGLNQEQQPDSCDDRFLSFEQLAKKHQNYIELIIEQEQDLMGVHKQHISTSIQLVKHEMGLMSEADKIGSNIQDYLDNLQSVLDQELASIHSVRERVLNMKKDLKESKRIETMYREENERMLESNQYGYGQPLSIPLEDDENLFH